MTFTARPIQTIINEMVVDKESRTELDGLTSSSNAAIWYNLLALFAAESHIIETQFEGLEADLDSRKFELQVGTVDWYAQESLNFQYGDSLTVINGVPQYVTEDDTKKVVIAASATGHGGFVLIKAAQDDGSGNPEALSAARLAAFTQYWIEKRFGGVALTIISQAGDVMQIYARIEIDAQVLSTTGESQTSPGTYPVEEAILEYLKTLDFNGRFTISGLEDAIQTVNGVGNSVNITSVLVKENGGSSYTDVVLASDKAYISVAGYIIEDSIVLRDTLTYAAV